MKKLTNLLIATAFLSSTLLTSPRSQALTAQEYSQRPKLVVVLVIDQFRSDMLTRFEKQFMPAGTPANPGGFRYLTSQGAWFPFAEYDILQAMTCTGHAMILTGSHPASTGIGTNEWFTPATKKMTYCAEDTEFGLSPRRLRTTTVGDELKNIKPKSKVVAVALKDRSAIMLGGHRADVVIWQDAKTSAWTSSNYYNKGQLPDWATKFDADFKKKNLKLEERTVSSAAAGVETTLDLALTALRAEKLGRGESTDLLAISLSNHDLLGHSFGPDSKEIAELTVLEDKLVANFLRSLRKEMGGLQDVVIALTADHGTPPTSELASKNKIASGRFEFLPMHKRINERLEKKFGSPGKEGWFLGSRLFHFFLNQDLIADKKINSSDVEDEVKKVLLEEPGVHAVFTKSDYAKGLYPPGIVGQQLKNSYVPGQSGDIVLIAKPFFYEKGGSPVTHMTGWSYDRSVPIILVGRAFKPGVYPGGLVIDIAPTISFLLGVLPPAMNEGRVLSEALR